MSYCHGNLLYDRWWIEGPSRSGLWVTWPSCLGRLLEHDWATVSCMHSPAWPFMMLNCLLTRWCQCLLLQIVFLSNESTILDIKQIKVDEYLERCIASLWRLMTWCHVAPGHQQPQWFFSTVDSFNYRGLSVRQDQAWCRLPTDMKTWNAKLFTNQVNQKSIKGGSGCQKWYF